MCFCVSCQQQKPRELHYDTEYLYEEPPCIRVAEIGACGAMISFILAAPVLFSICVGVTLSGICVNVIDNMYNHCLPCQPTRLRPRARPDRHRQVRFDEGGPPPNPQDVVYTARVVEPSHHCCKED